MARCGEQGVGVEYEHPGSHNEKNESSLDVKLWNAG